MVDDLSILAKVARFYRDECCVPYAISFYLTLIIYVLDFHLAPKPLIWPSATSYAILTAYYVQIIARYRQIAREKDDPKFFISFLTLKIVLWGILLIALLRSVTE